MITQNQKVSLLEGIVEALELPESAYDKAKQRYEDLGKWFDRNGSIVAANMPHIFPQGSFRLGTAIRPLNEDEAYDLDLACKLQQNITKNSHTQKELKHLIGREIEAYRESVRIKSPIQEKHRCWRLEYADTLSFHMDVVPCISADNDKREYIKKAMKSIGEAEYIANSASDNAVAITDDRHDRYGEICTDWNISNPEGYAQWFDSRKLLTESIRIAKARVDDIPKFMKYKAPLQRVVQLLKRHRDHMFRGKPEHKPISIIITTLAARAYKGESDILTALTGVLANMGDLVSSVDPRVPNPVNPSEDFADRWSMMGYKHLQLEDNFWNWLRQARADMETLLSSDDVVYLSEHASRKFAANIGAETLRQRLGISTSQASVRVAAPTVIISNPAKPWRRSE